MSDIKKTLAKSKKLWAKSKQRVENGEGGSYEEFEDGRYAAKVVKMSVMESEKGNLMVLCGYKVTEGEYKDKTITKPDMLISEENMLRFGAKLKKLGFEMPDEIEDLESVLKKIEKKSPSVRIRVKTNGEFQNVYVDKLISSSEEEDADGSDEVAEDEDSVTLEVGMSVSAEVDGDTIEGKIVKLLESKGKVKIVDEDGETYLVSNEDITVSESEDDDDDDDYKGADADDADEAEDEDEDSEEDEDEDEDEEEDSDDEDEEEEEEEEEEPKKKVTKKTSTLKKRK